jgi:hypothetical protein
MELKISPVKHAPQQRAHYHFLALFAKQRGQVQRSVDRASRYASDIYANALA